MPRVVVRVVTVRNWRCTLSSVTLKQMPYSQGFRGIIFNLNEKQDISTLFSALAIF
jgi:hypothetical protein